MGLPFYPRLSSTTHAHPHPHARPTWLMDLRYAPGVDGGGGGTQHEAALTVGAGHAVGAAAQPRVLGRSVLWLALGQGRCGTGVCPWGDEGYPFADELADVEFDDLLTLLMKRRVCR